MNEEHEEGSERIEGRRGCRSVDLYTYMNTVSLAISRFGGQPVTA